MNLHWFPFRKQRSYIVYRLSNPTFRVWTILVNQTLECLHWLLRKPTSSSHKSSLLWRLSISIQGSFGSCFRFLIGPTINRPYNLSCHHIVKLIPWRMHIQQNNTGLSPIHTYTHYAYCICANFIWTMYDLIWTMSNLDWTSSNLWWSVQLQIKRVQWTTLRFCIKLDNVAYRIKAE